MKEQEVNGNCSSSVSRWLRLSAGVLWVASAVLLAVTGAHGEKASQPAYTVIDEFGTNFGEHPYAGLIVDSAGNLYGTTAIGGMYGYGTVYELQATGGETVLYNFTGGADGAYPDGSLLRKPDGTLYGTAEGGGIFNSTCSSGCGVVFEVSPRGKEKVLYSFSGGADGYEPSSNLIADGAGNLYGVTPFGGSITSCVRDGAVGCGVVYEVSLAGKLTVLYTFTGGADGANPAYGLLRDGAGNLYGTTTDGGNLSSCVPGYGCGVAFSLAPGGIETLLYTFTGESDGGGPDSGLIEDSAGNLYGTAQFGGDLSCGNESIAGCGIVFELGPTGSETVLHTFTGPDGEYPVGGLLREPSSGILYGVTAEGGANGEGCIFAANSAGKEGVLHSFDYTDGALPIDAGGLVAYHGQIYGTTYNGGPFPGFGVAFKLTP
jgi:uncharacterized repeat protein (TIGR03803 family)